MATSPALAPPPGNPRFPLMDSLRGLACVAVVVAHSYGGVRLGTDPYFGYWDTVARALGVGVQVFFALSGFLLVRPYLVAHAGGGDGPSPNLFWRRRILRIVPAYWVALTVTALVVPAAAPNVFYDGWWKVYFFLGAYTHDTVGHGLGPAWSLTAEATFYLLIPLMAVLFRRRGVWPLVSLLLVMGLIVRVAFALSPDDPFLIRIVYGFPGQAPFFAIGIALAWWSVHGPPALLRRLVGRPGLCWLAAAGIYMATAPLFAYDHPLAAISFSVRFICSYLSTVLVVSLLLVPTAFERPGFIRRWLSRKELVFVGVVSYGIYLWHSGLEQHILEHGLLRVVDSWPLLARFSLVFVVVMAASLATAVFSYYVVELPFLRRKEPREGKARLIGAPSEPAGAPVGAVRPS